MSEYEVTEATPYPELKRLARRIHRSSGEFSLFFVECNDSALRHQLAQTLVEKFDCPATLITLPSPSDNESIVAFDQFIEKRTKNEPLDKSIFLFDLEYWLPTLSKETLHQTVQQINWRRNYFARLQRPLVIWLPQYALRILAEYTPDFYDWYSGIFVFKAVQADQLAQIERAFDGMNSTASLNKQEAQRWLHTLNALLNENTDNNQFRVSLLSDASDIYYRLGDYDTTLKYLSESLAITQTIGDKAGEGATLNNISQIYAARGDYETALKYLSESLAITQAIGNKAGEGATLNNMASIYHARGDYDTALKYLADSLVIQQAIGDKQGEGTTLNNISQIYRARGDNDTALKYLADSLVIQQAIGDKQGEGTTLNNISQIYRARGDYETALKYLEKSLAIRQAIGDKAGLCATLFNIGYIYLENNEPQKALSYWIHVYQIAKDIGEVKALSNLEDLASKLGLEGGLAAWEALAEKMNMNKDDA